jgi:hypothetical protein
MRKRPSFIHIGGRFRYNISVDFKTLKAISGSHRTLERHKNRCPAIFADDGTMTPLPTFASPPITLTDAVPEPSTWEMMLFGFISVGFVG